MRFQSFLIAILSLCLSFFNALCSAPSVTSLTPSAGPTFGGTEIIITGSGFVGTSAVFFGQNPASQFRVDSDHQITAISPIHSPNIVLITVQKSNQISADTSGAYFAYQGGWEAFVANVSTGILSIVDTHTKTKTATLKVGDRPVKIVLTSDGEYAYVVNNESNNISIIQTVTNDIKTIPVGDSPIDIAIAPNELYAYVVNQGDCTISVVDIAENQVLKIIDVHNPPNAIAIEPDGDYAYVAHEEDGSISVIDIEKNQVIQIIDVGGAPNAIAITVDGEYAYVTNAGSNGDEIVIINTPVNQIVETILNVANSSAIAIANTPNGSFAYVANSIENDVSVINLVTNTIIKIIKVGESPESIAISSDGTQAFIVSDSLESSNGGILVIDTATNQVISTIAVSADPIAIAIMPERAPMAKFTHTKAMTALASVFDASQSASPLGMIINYLWDFGDGTTINTSQPSISHTYTEPGNYLATLIVTNSNGLSIDQISKPFPPNSINGFNSKSKEAISAKVQKMITVFPSAPVVLSSFPSFGSAYGGTVVTITGENLSGTTAILFGSTPASQFSIQSDQSIIAITPPGNQEVVNITVVTHSSTSDIMHDTQFTYLSIDENQCSSVIEKNITLLPPKYLKGRQKKQHPSSRFVTNVLTWETPSESIKPVVYRIYRDKALIKLVKEVSAKRKLKFIDRKLKEGKNYRYFVVSVDQFGNQSSPEKVVVKK